MEEDKQAICDKLCEALRLTKAGQSIKSLEVLYSETLPRREYIIIVRERPEPAQQIEISGDSGVRMIADVMNRVIGP